jgi:hypothetical protein
MGRGDLPTLKKPLVVGFPLSVRCVNPPERIEEILIDQFADAKLLVNYPLKLLLRAPQKVKKQ